MRRIARALALLLACAPIASCRASDQDPRHAAFTQEVHAALQAAAPNEKFTVAGPLEIHWLHPDADNGDRIYLDNLYKNIPEDPRERAEAIETYVRVLLNPIRVTLSAEDRSRIFPVIRDQAFLESVGELAPVADPLVSDLRVLYVVDFPDRVQYIGAPAAQELGVETAELRKLALANFSPRSVEAKLTAIGPIQRVELDGTYDSSLLLVDPLWERVAATLGADPVVAVPTRDVLVVAPSVDADAVANLREFARRLEEEGGYPISSGLLIRRGSTWQAFP